MVADQGSGPSSPEEGTLFWWEVLSDTERRLAAGASPSREARWIVAAVSGIEDGAGLNLPATPRHVARLDVLVDRRLAGEPLQYVLGRWPFRGLDLMIDRRVLIPRAETEVVAGFALEECNRAAASQPLGEPVHVADLGCGSGAIGLAVAAEHPAARVWCTDVSTDALAVARANLAGLGLPARRVSLVEGSWFSALPACMAGRFDVVVSNPPYVADSEPLPPEVADWEPQAALRAGPRGTEDLVHLVEEAPAWLTSDGALVLELSPVSANAVAERARSLGYRVVGVHPDLVGRDRVLVARRPS